MSLGPPHMAVGDPSGLEEALSKESKGFLGGIRFRCTLSFICVGRLCLGVRYAQRLAEADLLELESQGLEPHDMGARSQASGLLRARAGRGLNGGTISPAPPPRVLKAANTTMAEVSTPGIT